MSARRGRGSRPLPYAPVAAQLGDWLARESSATEAVELSLQVRRSLGERWAVRVPRGTDEATRAALALEWDAVIRLAQRTGDTVGDVVAVRRAAEAWWNAGDGARSGELRALADAADGALAASPPDLAVLHRLRAARRASIAGRASPVVATSAFREERIRAASPPKRARVAAALALAAVLLTVGLVAASGSGDREPASPWEPRLSASEPSWVDGWLAKLPWAEEPPAPQEAPFGFGFPSEPQVDDARAARRGAWPGDGKAQYGAARPAPARLQDRAPAPAPPGWQVTPQPIATPEAAVAVAPQPEPIVEAPPADADPAMPLPAEPGGVVYSVLGVEAGDFLNVRSAPDASAALAMRLPPNASGLRATGRTELRGEARWVELDASGRTGWANRAFLAEAPRANCGAPDVSAVVERFATAVRVDNGNLLRASASPVRGLWMRLGPRGATVRWSAAELSDVFRSSAVRTWSRPGEPQNTGSFKEVALPSLQAAIPPNAPSFCGRVVAPAGVSKEWPTDLAPLVPVTFLRGPESNPLGAWVLGLEFVEGKPYVAALVRYEAESAPTEARADAKATEPGAAPASPSPAAIAGATPAASVAAASNKSPKSDSSKEPSATEPPKSATAAKPVEQNVAPAPDAKKRTEADGDKKKRDKKKKKD